MGLVCGNLHPSVLLANNSTTPCYKVYTQHLGFRAKAWVKLPPYFLRYAEECTYSSVPNTKPLCHTGLIGKVGEVSPVPEKLLGWEVMPIPEGSKQLVSSIETLVQRLVEQVLLDNSVFSSLLKDRASFYDGAASNRE